MKNPAVGALAQRVLFSLLFVMAGVSHVMNWQGTVGATGAVFGYGPGAVVLSAIAVVLLVGGGLSILSGKFTDMGGWMLTAFLLGGAYVHYTFANNAFSASDQQMQIAHLMKNVALIGVALRYALGGSVKS